MFNNLNKTLNMTTEQLATLVFQNLDPADTADFATKLKNKIMDGYTSEVAGQIADQLYSVGIELKNIPCKRYPT